MAGVTVVPVLVFVVWNDDSIVVCELSGDDAAVDVDGDVVGAVMVMITFGLKVLRETMDTSSDADVDGTDSFLLDDVSSDPAVLPAVEEAFDTTGTSLLLLSLMLETFMVANNAFSIASL